MSNLVNFQPYRIANHNALLSSYPTCMIPSMVYSSCKLKVNGKGSIMVNPDEAVIVLGVTNENIQLENAQKENAEKVAAIINTLLKLGVLKEDIQTQTYQIQPQYDYVDGKQIFRGYRVIHNLKVNVKNISMVGKIVDTAGRNRRKFYQ